MLPLRSLWLTTVVGMHLVCLVRLQASRLRRSSRAYCHEASITSPGGKGHWPEGSEQPLADSAEECHQLPTKRTL